MTELNYANIEADLGSYMQSILTQCANMEEVEVIQTLFLIIWSIIMARWSSLTFLRTTTTWTTRRRATGRNHCATDTQILWHTHSINNTSGGGFKTEQTCFSKRRQRWFFCSGWWLVMMNARRGCRTFTGRSRGIFLYKTLPPRLSTYPMFSFSLSAIPSWCSLTTLGGLTSSSNPREKAETITRTWTGMKRTPQKVGFSPSSVQRSTRLFSAWSLPMWSICSTWHFFISPSRTRIRRANELGPDGISSCLRSSPSSSCSRTSWRWSPSRTSGVPSGTLTLW